MGLLAFNGGIGLLECAGFTISHNLIHDTPKSCIENRNGIKILIEYNEMHNIALKSGDTGADVQLWRVVYIWQRSAV